MMTDLRKTAFSIALMLFIACTGGCTHFFPDRPAGTGTDLPVSQPENQTDGDETGEYQWRQVRFRYFWPENMPPQWHWDLLIAHRIVGPLISESDIPLWRFHRRAARDAAGHQFSFLFYASRPTAERIHAALKSSAELQDLLTDQVLEEVLYDPVDFSSASSPAKPLPESTSDASWPELVRKTWPYYIMGVSRMWLEMIRLTDAELPADESGRDIRSDRYREMHRRMQVVWQKNGQHAFLHHLNALFGYEGVIITEKHLMRF